MADATCECASRCIGHWHCGAQGGSSLEKRAYDNAPYAAAASPRSNLPIDKQRRGHKAALSARPFRFLFQLHYSVRLHCNCSLGYYKSWLYSFFSAWLVSVLAEQV